MSDLAIRVENLSKQYTIGRAQERHDTLRDALAGVFRRNGAGGSTETFWALKDVSFEVKRGEVVGIIGRNGAGKSTLLKILSQITEPTSGRAEIHGRVGSLLEVGTGFHPELTGRENIFLNGAILGMRREEISRRFDEIVAFAEIDKFLDTPVKRYSSGMYVRLAFAVAAHLEPEILLVDEVLAVGDAAFQKKALGKMSEVVGQGRTVIFVSHNMNAISRLCARVMLVQGGGIAYDGEATAAISRYLGVQREWSNLPSLDEWDVNRRPGLFIESASINGVELPAEVVFLTNERIEFRIRVNTRQRSIWRFRAGIHFSTEDGIRIMSLATPWSSLGDELEVKHPTSFVCTLPRFPFLPGRYLISIGCMEGNVQIDWLENLCLLNLVADEEMSQRLIPVQKTHGFFQINAEWEMLMADYQ
jgi:lipopolysaccharide transport system ATP-binding protein